MGCKNPKLTPGIEFSKVVCIFSANSSFDSAETHSFLSFKMIIKSHASIGIGSVGISAVPIFPTTCFTSGNLAKRILDILEVVSTVLVRLVPIIKRVSTAKSPSSKEGMNSAPKRLNNKIQLTKSTSKPTITFF